MNLSSPEFIQKIRDRDKMAFEQLICAYHEPLFFGALKQKLSEDQAEEVVQETWSTLFQNIENFEDRSHIRTYLFGIMYNKIKEIWRSNKKYTQEDDEYIDTLFDQHGNYITPPLDPSKWNESREFLEILEEELQTLPDNQRLAFYLKEIQGESTENICNILNVSVTNLGVLIYRAKASLRIKIEKRFKA